MLCKGETRFSSGTTPTNRLYTGQIEEPELGLYFYNARWYDPALGRFTQPDSIVPQPGSPLAWDRYAYTLNNPVNWIDPSGHKACDDQDSSICSAYDNSIESTAKRYRIRFKGNWTNKDKIEMISGVEYIDRRLDRFSNWSYKQGRSFTKLFRPMVFALTQSKDQDGWYCEAGGGFTCGGGAINQMTARLTVHEFGHVFDANGNYLGRTTIGNSTIENALGEYVSGINPTTGKWERTIDGYVDDEIPWVEHPVHNDGNTNYEDFADMFLNWVYQSFASTGSNALAGNARYEWMTNNMPDFIDAIR